VVWLAGLFASKIDVDNDSELKKALEKLIPHILFLEFIVSLARFADSEVS
jgi:hypothetical protein